MGYGYADFAALRSGGSAAKQGYLASIVANSPAFAADLRLVRQARERCYGLFTKGSLMMILTAALAAAALPPTQQIAVAPGRTLALRCSGRGIPTVLFDSGGSDWSPVWALVQPAVAERTRACTYDRAGFGESPAARGQRTPGAIAEDIHALIGAARLGPVLLVGHSLGGFNAKLTAALYPKDVAGLLLLDPAEDRTWARTRTRLSTRFGASTAARAELADHTFIGALVDHYRRCAAKAETGPLDLADPAWRRCGDPDRPALGDALNAERRRIHATPAYQAAQSSEIAWSVYGTASADPVYAMLFRPGSFGRKPLVVLTHQEEPSDDPVDRLNAAQGIMLHRETATLSTTGKQMNVTKSGHYLQLDRPQLVIDAIVEMLGQIGKR